MCLRLRQVLEGSDAKPSQRPQRATVSFGDSATQTPVSAGWSRAELTELLLFPLPERMRVPSPYPAVHDMVEYVRTHVLLLLLL